MNKYAFERFIRSSVIIVWIVFGLFIARLAYLQILHGQEFLEDSRNNRVRVINVPAPRGIIYDRNGEPIVKNKPSFSVSILPLAKKVDLKRLSALLDLDEEQLDKKVRKRAASPFSTIVLKEGLSFSDLAKIEARRSDFPGLTIETEVTRDYIHGSVAAHLIGYLGKPTESQLAGGEFDGLDPDTLVGKWGVEKLYNKLLMGVPGKKIMEVNALGTPLGVLENIAPVKGNDIRLTIDLDVQTAAERAFGERTGALFAFDPSNGDVLAVVSLPSFEPTDFTLGIDPTIWNRLNKDPRHPLLNRVFQSAYPPGSVFKTVVSIAGVEKGLLPDNFGVYCNGVKYLGSHPFGCWRKTGHGHMRFPDGLIQSCDVFFYELGERLGVDTMYKYATMLGLGLRTDIGLCSESGGLIPSTAWKKKRFHENWYTGETLNTAIGQGYDLVTPVQAAVMIGAVGNDGIVYPLTILTDTKERRPRPRLQISKHTFDTVKIGLRGVVHDPHGTAKVCDSKIIEIAGKTGTAQVVKGRLDTHKQAAEVKDHAWFVAFAPIDNPRIALSVFVEHGGHGGSAAAPIAKEVIETYARKIYPQVEKETDR